jgi:DNA repair exonuclease SbcCD ATPase subunit
MIRIKKLKLENIGRFVGQHEVDFSVLNGLTQVDGRNLNTGGSSGSGKSTVFSAIEYSLGINDVPASSLQSRLTKSPIKVELTLDVDGNEVVVSRGKSGLKLVENQIEITGSVKEMEDRLSSLLKLGPDLLRPMLHKRQGEGGMILSMTPKQYYEFLSEMLDLGSYTKKQDKADQAVTAAKLEIEKVSQELTITKARRMEAEGVLASITPPEASNVTEEGVAALGRARDHAMASFKRAEASVKNKIASIPVPTKQSVPRPNTSNIDANIKELESEKHRIKAEEAKKRSSIEEKIKIIKSLISDAAIKRAQIADLEESLREKTLLISSEGKDCPTCKRHWPEGAEAERNKNIQKKQELESKLALAKDTVIKAERAMPILAALEKEAQFSFDVSHLDQKIQESLISKKLIEDKYLADVFQADDAFSKVFAAYLSKKKKTEEEGEKELEPLRYAYEEAERTFKAAKASYDAATEALKRYTDMVHNTQKTIEDLKQKEAALGAKSLELEADCAFKISCSEILKKYVNQLFKTSLDQIAIRATEILKAVPNTCTMAVTFDTLKETKAGAIKEEVTAIVSMDGDVGVPIKTLSGGERTAVDLAVDLAAIEMIEMASGKGIDLFILDEPFDGLDSVCKENCLEVLNSYRNSQKVSKKILIVDHSNETKQMISDRIQIERNGLESRVMQ